jgi:iron complex outermembrane receptor protein
VPVCEGRVSIGGQSYTAPGAKWSRTLRDEDLAGLKLAAPIAANTTARLAISTYQVPRTDTFTSNGYAAGKTNGPATSPRRGRRVGGPAI